GRQGAGAGGGVRAERGPGGRRMARSPPEPIETERGREELRCPTRDPPESASTPARGPPLHVHTREDETVYILEGEFRWKLGEERSVSGPGSFVFIPRGLPHTWQCLGDEPGKMLITFAPAGMEGFFESLSSLTEFDPEAFR